MPLTILWTLCFSALGTFLCFSAHAQSDTANQPYFLFPAQPPARVYQPYGDDLTGRQAQLALRLQQLTELERSLVRQDRRAHRAWPGGVLMAVGFGAGAVSSYVATMAILGGDGISDNVSNGFYLAHVIGVPLGLVGIGLIAYQVTRRPHRAQVSRIKRERARLKRELRGSLRHSARPNLTVTVGLSQTRIVWAF